MTHVSTKQAYLAATPTIDSGNKASLSLNSKSHSC
jgi:hypothetical protein